MEMVDNLTLLFFSIEVPGIESVETADTVKLLLLLTVLSLAPAIMVTVTSFTRIAIVLSFTRTAVGTNNLPPNQVLIALALFLTLFTMAPVFGQLVEDVWQPFVADEIEQEQAFALTGDILREFMLEHVNQKDLSMFLEAGEFEVEDYQDVPLTALIPAFIISELKTAFQMGFMIFVPFLVIDMVVASTLLSMGMFMLPPAMMSLPLKVLVFVLADGWHLVVRSLLAAYF